MTPIKLLQSGLDVSEISWALKEHPQLWNEHTARTAPENSPHHGLDDIWVRYGSPKCAETGEEHQAFWYPSAELLMVKPIVDAVFSLVDGVELGGVLITRIPAGAMCKPHEDHGWHARYYEKFAVQIESAPAQRFHFEGASLETKPGDLFWFDNQYLHWVNNPTNYERVTMIICIRRGN